MTVKTFDTYSELGAGMELHLEAGHIEVTHANYYKLPPKAVRHAGVLVGGSRLPPKAVRHAGVLVGGSRLPPKAAQHAGVLVGGSRLPPKAAQHVSKA